MGLLGDITGALGKVAGVMSPIGTIAGGVSALGSLFGTSPADKAAALAEKQHQWDVEENAKNRQFQKDEWTRQFNAINAYNDPKATKERLQNAGLNGSAILNGQGAAIGQSTGSPSAPSGASGLNPMPDLVSQVGFQSQESLFRRLQMLGDMSKNSALLPATKQKLDVEIQNVLNDSRFKEIKADSEEFMLSLNKYFSPHERNVGLRQALNNLALTDAETRLAIANGEYVNENKQNLAEERLLTIAKRNLSQKEFEKLQLEIKWYDKIRQQEINESRSREGLNNANAQTENDLRAGRKLALDLSNELKGLESDFNYATFQKRLEKFSSEVGIVKWTELMSQMEQKDRSAYNAVQRLMLGKGSYQDGLEVIKFLRNYSTDNFDLSK